MSTRAIEYLPLDGVQPADRNPKSHDMAMLTLSFDRFGYVEPIMRDDRTERLVAGHGRLDELRLARARDPQSPPDGVQLADDGTWLVPVVTGWASKDDADAEAYLLAANRIVELGGWDEAVLTEALSALADLGEQALVGSGYGYDDALALLSKQMGAELDDDDDTSPQLDGLSYRVVVDCESEAHQAAVMGQLDDLGLSVRAVVN